MVVPLPGTTDEYYLTVLREGGASATTPMAQYYHILASDTGSGNLTITGPNDLQKDLTQSQTSVPKISSDGTVSDEYWWVSHEMCNNNFVVYAVADSGISLSSKYAVGPNFVCSAGFPPRYDAVGTMKFNSCYTKLACVISDKVTLYDFDPLTGQITYINSVESSDLNQAYSAEFSPNGDYLYICNGMDNYNPGEIFRSEISSAGLGTPQLMGPTGGMRGGHMQLAPDGNIYYAIPVAFGNAGKGKIGRITYPNDGGVMDNDWYEATAAKMFSSDEDQWVNMDMPTLMKGFVVSKPKLLLNGTDWSRSQICVGEYANFEIEISGDVISNIISWTAVGSNSGSQTGGATFNMLMSNIGSTTLNVMFIDQCGREKEVEFEVVTHEIQKPSSSVDYSSCPKPTLTGEGSLTGMYKWYNTDPSSDTAKLLWIGENFKANAENSYWVAPAGNVTHSIINDSRAQAGFGVATGNTSLIVEEGLAVIKQFNILFKHSNYSNIEDTMQGTFGVELKSNTGQTIGEVLSIYYNELLGWDGDTLALNPKDWILEPGTYNIKLTKPEWANIPAFYESDFSSDFLVLNGGQISNIISHVYSENFSFECFESEGIIVEACCSSTNANLIDSISKNPHKEIYCENEVYFVEAHVIDSVVSPVNFKWSKDASGMESVFNGFTSVGSYTYQVVVEAGGCLDTMEVQVDVVPSDSLIMNIDGDFETCSSITSLSSKPEFDDYVNFEIIDINGRIIKRIKNKYLLSDQLSQKGVYFLRHKSRDGSIRIRKVIFF